MINMKASKDSRDHHINARKHNMWVDALDPLSTALEDNYEALDVMVVDSMVRPKSLGLD
jgi:hypothetical protein